MRKVGWGEREREREAEGEAEREGERERDGVVRLFFVPSLGPVGEREREEEEEEMVDREREGEREREREGVGENAPRSTDQLGSTLPLPGPKRERREGGSDLSL